MGLTRQDLLADTARHDLSRSVLAARLLSDDELERSRIDALTRWNRAESLWVFGYGSLIWNPQLDFAKKEVGRIFGVHRRLCLWSRVNRGTPDAPGLVFGLERGGSCVGVAYEIPAMKVDHETRLLWRREMLLGSYRPTWIRFQAAQRRSVLTFRVDPTSVGYAGRLSDSAVVTVLSSACGRYGTCFDYVNATVESLREAGIRDRALERIIRMAHAQLPHTQHK